MTSRVEEYLLPDGTWSRHRAGSAALTTPAEIRAALLEAAAALFTPPGLQGYLLGTAKHETNLALNERDTEPPAEDGHVVVTWGVYQLEEEEATSVGLGDGGGRALLDLARATAVLARLATRRAHEIEVWARGSDYTADLTDLPAYLAIYHNQGAGPAKKTVQRHGVDWAAYKSRNLAAMREEMARDGIDQDEYERRHGWIRVITSSYGDDVLRPDGGLP